MKFFYKKNIQYLYKMRLYIRNSLLQPNIWYSSSDMSQLYISLDQNTNNNYTLVIYDIDAPYPSDPINSPFIHLLIINISGNDMSTGQILFNYTPPNSPSGEAHRYIIALYEQKSPITSATFINRANFPLDNFINQYNLRLIANELLLVDINNKSLYLIEGNNQTQQQVTFNHPYIVADSGLNETEQNYCACIVEVATKQPGACNLEKAWFEQKDNRECYNPFAVCASSTGGSNRKCYQNYNYDILSDQQITALANLINVDINSPRSTLINNLKIK